MPTVTTRTRALPRVALKAGVAALSLAGIAAILTGCGGTSHHPSSTGSSSPTTSAAATGSAGAASDIAAITTLYTTIVNPAVPLTAKVPEIQDGQAFLAAMQQLSASAFAKQVSITVSHVTVTSANLATVTFSILLNGSAVLPNTTGYAVRENGQWKIAGATLCGLLAASSASTGGTVPAVCSQPAATALPS